MTVESSLTELACRAGHGVEVRLLWDPGTNALFVTLDDGRTGEAFELYVEPAEALDAFNHPFAYAARAGVEHAAGEAVPAGA